MIISYYAIFVKKCVFMQYGCLKGHQLYYVTDNIQKNEIQSENS